MIQRLFKKGDLVVYRKAKYTTHPGKRARSVDAASRGEFYHYVVDKFWKVTDVRDDGELVAVTRGGKQHVIPADDLNLRHANLLDLIRHWRKFPRTRNTSKRGPHSSVATDIWRLSRVTAAMQMRAAQAALSGLLHE